MKAIYFMASFIFFSLLATAQTNTSLNQTLKSPRAKLIGQSKFGKVYALPIDNMPCIVSPKPSAALIPVFNTPLINDGIPNAFPKQELFAAQSLQNNFLTLIKGPNETSKNLMLNLIRKK